MIKAVVIPHTFHFNFPGGTSRGVLTEKPSFILKIWDKNTPNIAGFGEVSLIPGLSPENPKEVEKLLIEFTNHPENFVRNANLDNFPAVKFGIETAFLDLKNGGKQILFPSEFTAGNKGIRINGLVWMGEKNEMLKRLKEKVAQGFTCIKIKVGAIDFNEELSLLKYIRNSYSTNELEIRLDANGAFTNDNALIKLRTLAEYGIHSIEQPIKQGQWNEMAELCKTSPIPIALDEELIGITDKNKRISVLDTIKPQYIILKPSLIGGLEEAKKWSELASERNIYWWLTSALEGNIGLNALAQWTFVFGSNMPQGLGTGQVFTNNIKSPLEIRGEKLWYNPAINWNLSSLKWENSTPALRTPPQGGEGTLKPYDNIIQTENETLHSSTQSQFNAVPLEGVPERRGWNSASDSNNTNSETQVLIKPKNVILGSEEKSTPVLRTPPQGGEGTLKPLDYKKHSENENLHNSKQGQFNAVPLEGEVHRGGRGWKNTLATKENNYHYNTKLKDRAIYLRKHATKAEACLWKYTLNKRPMGFQFSRQRPVLNYIADFMCTELMLIIEVDGATHFMDDLPNNDLKRQADLEAIGFTVFRFEDEGVLKNMSGIQTVLEQFITEFLKLKKSTPVLRTPPQGGEGTLKPQGNSPQTETDSPHSSTQSQFNAVPLEGVPERRGWNITLNSITYDLKNTDWNTLHVLNKNESWWQAIIEFLKEWANNLPTVTLTTSGSTGEPKQIVVGKAQMWVSATKTCEFFSLNENSTGLLCLSANYIAGKMMLVRAIVSGMNLICIEPSGNPVKELKTPIDFAAMVPMQVEQSLLQTNKLNLIKNLIVGGGKVSNALVSKLQTYTGNAFETFGMTETLSHIALKQLRPKYQEYFTPFNGVFILQGYNNVLVIDFPELGIYKLKTTDIIEIINPAGCFIWKGRTDFIINSGGMKISPEEIESKIAHLVTQRFCICGVPDSKLGESIMLIIEGESYPTVTLIQKINEILPSYFRPKKIQFVQSFPLTETGKIKRTELVKLVQ